MLEDMRRELREKFERLKRGNSYSGSIDPKYYRAIPVPEDYPCECGLLEPHLTDVEKVKCRDSFCQLVYWAPLVQAPPFFARSTEKVLCFSKTPGGAVIGSVTGEYEFEGGKRCICETTDKPDVDISHELVGDFEVLEEVRFHKPVNTKVTGEFVVNDKTLREIEACYEEPFDVKPNIEKLEEIKTRINQKLGKARAGESSLSP